MVDRIEDGDPSVGSHGQGFRTAPDPSASSSRPTSPVPSPQGRVTSTCPLPERWSRCLWLQVRPQAVGHHWRPALGSLQPGAVPHRALRVRTTPRLALLGRGCCHPASSPLPRTKPGAMSAQAASAQRPVAPVDASSTVRRRHPREFVRRFLCRRATTAADARPPAKARRPGRRDPSRGRRSKILWTMLPPLLWMTSWSEAREGRQRRAMRPWVGVGGRSPVCAWSSPTSGALRPGLGSRLGVREYADRGASLTTHARCAAGGMDRLLPCGAVHWVAAPRRRQDATADGAGSSIGRSSGVRLIVLFFADVVGKPGRELLAAKLSGLRARFQADAVIVNAENAANGVGITPAVARSSLPEPT